MVEVEREEGEMVEFGETLKALDKVVESEFHEDSTSGQDTSRWIMPYDPSSREVLLWKGAIVARVLHNADLNCKGTALYKKVLVEDDAMVSKLLATSHARMRMSQTVTPAAAAAVAATSQVRTSTTSLC